MRTFIQGKFSYSGNPVHVPELVTKIKDHTIVEAQSIVKNFIQALYWNKTIKISPEDLEFETNAFTPDILFVRDKKTGEIIFTDSNDVIWGQGEMEIRI